MSDFVMCPCEGQTLDRLIQPAILVVLAGGPPHGYRLVERIGKMPGFSGQKPDASGVYRFSKTMERKELVAASWNISDTGPAKKSYRITPAGRQCLTWIQTLDNYRRGITGLLGAARKAAQDQASDAAPAASKLRRPGFWAASCSQAMGPKRWIVVLLCEQGVRTVTEKLPA